mmetsp:Transcript_31277/g.104512  ORF Transcript_31277/g.104512 Transcript_31277/m.104512 type:complete len:213 (-) Transcript_31277:28-666(-)
MRRGGGGPGGARPDCSPDGGGAQHCALGLLALRRHTRAPRRRHVFRVRRLARRVEVRRRRGGRGANRGALLPRRRHPRPRAHRLAASRAVRCLQPLHAGGRRRRPRRGGAAGERRARLPRVLPAREDGALDGAVRDEALARLSGRRVCVRARRAALASILAARLSAAWLVVTVSSEGWFLVALLERVGFHPKRVRATTFCNDAVLAGRCASI